MSTPLTPFQAAKVANDVYRLKDNTDVSQVVKQTGGMGVGQNFDMEGGSRFTGSSGPLVFKKRTGFGLIAPGTGTRKSEVLIATRGTASVRDALTDMNAGLQKGPGGFAVHAGFNDSFNSFRQDIDTFLDKNGAIGTVHCVGHSLGGALATLVADHLVASGVKNIKLYSFGCPRVGVKGFSRNLTSKLTSNNIFRAYHEADPVSMVPIFPFAHVPDTSISYLLPYNGMNISPAAHKMDNYANTIGDAGWDALPKPLAAVSMSDQIDAFLSSPAAGPMFNNARVLWMINKAIHWILKKAGMLTGLITTVGLTLLDRIAYLLSQAASKTIELGRLVGSLVNSIFRFLGRTAVAGAQLTITFLRWVLGLLFSSIAMTVGTAVALAHNGF
jgi:pimeloyl-ACP methyl ester carboxylesterase